MRVSRFTVQQNSQLAESEVELLSWPYDTEHVFHMGGGMWMDGEEDLYIATGDNSHHSPGLPVDLRPDWKNWDSYRSAANTRDHRGKILRIHPNADGSYSVPKDNLFPDGKNGLLKLAFLDLPLERVFEAEQKGNPTLSRMLHALATERQAAGRSVWADTDRLIARAPMVTDPETP